MLFVLFAFFPVFALAASPQCIISFDSAKLDVCQQRITMVNEDLRLLADERVFADSHIRVIKFDGPIGRAQTSAVTALGAEILGYVPYFGYKVRMNAALDAQARAISGVAWVGPYLPIWKVGINVANELKDGRILSQADKIDTLWVSLHPGVSTAHARDWLSGIEGVEFDFNGDSHDHEFLGLKFQRDSLPVIVEALGSHPDVNAISFHWPNELLNSQGAWLHQSGDSTSQAASIFEQGIYGCGQIAGALDSGLHSHHCSFQDTDFGDPVFDICADGSDCPAITPDFGHRKVGAHYQWRNSSSAPSDAQGHGTFVSGNLVGNNDANQAVDCENFTTPGGITNLDGMAPGAKFVIQEAGPNLDYLNFHGGSLYHAATVASNTGVNIHNNSWGSGCRQNGACIAGCQVQYRPHTRGGDMAAWENPELLVFASAGNSGSGCGPGADVGSPGNAKNVFSIGATGRGTLGNSMAGLSSRGPTSDRRTKPDMVAQGASLQSSSVSACGTTGNSGTSFSSPTAAGLSALVREYLQRGFYPLGLEEPAFAMSNPSAALIKAIMINGSAEIDGSGTSGEFPDVNQGWGSVLLDNSLYFDGGDRRLWLHDGTTGLESGDVDAHSVVADVGEPLTITLVWHDYFAEENADPHIVNLLRLEVETPDGEIWTQKLTPGGGLTDPNPFQGTTFDDYDDRNTVHQISFDAPAAGAYEVRVRGIQVAMGGQQPYALAATGNLLDVAGPVFILQSEPVDAVVCQAEEAVYEIGVLGVLDFDDPVDLTLTGEPAGATVNFSVNPATPAAPAAVSVLTIGDTATVTPGEYALELIGESDGPAYDPFAHSLDFMLQIDAVVAGPMLISPLDGEHGTGLQPQFSWDVLEGAFVYQFQLATDAGFTDIVIDEVLEDTAFTPKDKLSSGTVHYWRVRELDSNACGDGDWSAEFRFQTRFVPVAEVMPDGFVFEVQQGSADQETLVISNAGNGVLDWNIATVMCSGGVPPQWLSVDPDSGNTAAGDPSEVQVVVDAADMEAGEYQGGLCIGTNDEEHEQVPIPVELMVTPLPPGHLQVEPLSLDFGEIEIGTIAVMAVTVSNIAPAPAADLELADPVITSTGSAFEIIGTDCGATLPPQEICTVDIGFIPRAVAAYGSVSRLVGDGTVVNVSLSGEGIEPAPHPNDLFRDRFETPAE